jgi:phage terminase Nu1 subunit (DNA packaging protein)
MAHYKTLPKCFVTPSVLASFLDLTPNSVTRLANAGLPKAERGRYPLSECCRWYAERLKTRQLTHPTELNEERKKLIFAQRVGQALDNAEARRDVIAADLVAQVMQHLEGLIAARLDELPELAQELAHHRDPTTINRLLFAACRTARERMAGDVAAYAQSLAGTDG